MIYLIYLICPTCEPLSAGLLGWIVVRRATEKGQKRGFVERVVGRGAAFVRRVHRYIGYSIERSEVLGWRSRAPRRRSTVRGLSQKETLEARLAAVVTWLPQRIPGRVIEGGLVQQLQHQKEERGETRMGLGFHGAARLGGAGRNP